MPAAPGSRGPGGYSRGVPGEPAVLGPSQRRDIGLLVVVRGISFVGDGIALVALFLRVAPLGHAWAVAGLAIAGSLPFVVLAPLAGHVVDRVRARPLLVALGLAEALVCAGLALDTGVAAALGLLFALNCLVAFSVPGYTTLAVAIAGPGNAQRAQGPLQAAQGLAMVVGPMLGGLLVGLVGQRWPLGLDAVSFAVAGVGTALVVHDRRPTTPAPGEHVSAFAGIALVARDALLRPLAVDIFAFLATLGMVNVAEVFFVTQTLHGSPLAYGALGASFGAGTVVGSLQAARLSRDERHQAAWLCGTIVAVGLLVGGVSLVENVGEIYPLMVVAGVAVGIANVMAITLFSERAAEHLHGRLFAALGAITTTADVGATVAGGALLSVLAPRTVYLLGGVLATVAAVVFGALAMRAVTRGGGASAV